VYGHVFERNCNIVLDFSETKPVVRDILPEMRSSSQRPQIERGHRLIRINGTDVENLLYEEMLEGLAKRPLYLEFEGRNVQRASIEIATRNQMKAFVGGIEKRRRAMLPPVFPKPYDCDFSKIREKLVGPTKLSIASQKAVEKMAKEGLCV